MNVQQGFRDADHKTKRTAAGFCEALCPQTASQRIGAATVYRAPDSLTNVKTAKIPNADHPITIEPSEGRVRVLAGGRVIADSRNALALRESDYPVVHYIPRGEVDMTLLARTDNASYCPYKGDASYYSILPGGDGAINAVWSYEAPHDAVAAIRDYLAFYPDRVDAIEIYSE